MIELMVRRWAVRLLIILTSILVLEIVFHILVAPNTRITRIVFRGDMTLTDEELFLLTGLKKADHYFGIEEKILGEKLLSHPAVKSAVVEKVFPDTLKLTLIGRKALGLSLVNLGPKTMAVCFDKEGIVFQVQEGIKVWDLPVLSGVNFETVQMGMKFPKEALPVLETLERLESQEGPLLSLISEIRLVHRSGSGLDLELMPQAFQVKVLVKPQVSAKTLKEMFVLLDVIKNQGLLGKIKELDLRTGQPVLPFGERG